MSHAKSKAEAKTSTRRDYAFGGCGTCRRRHVKCDQVRPVCLTCRALGAVCDGFNVELTWVNLSKGPNSQKLVVDEHGTQVGRRHLYTESSRASMTHTLQTGLTSRSIDETISEVDAQSKNAITEVGGGLIVGPFGVFSLAQQSNSESGVSPSPHPVIVPPDSAHTEIPADKDTGPDVMRTIESLESFDQMNDLLDWSDLFDLGYNDTDLPWHSFTEDSNHAINPNLDPASLGLHEVIGGGQPAISKSCNSDSRNKPGAGAVLANHPLLLGTALGGFDLSEAQLLLKHFRDQVIYHIRVMPLLKRSPWEILNLDMALLTLVRLTVTDSERVTHAALANLYALLAFSSAHLAGQQAQQPSGCPSRWQELSASAIQNAKRNLQQSLKDEFGGPNKAKYKDQLMAIMAMLAFSVAYDKQKDARVYMIDAERLLRVRGLGKRTISRRARLLHHVYTWTRIVNESTFVLGTQAIAELEPAFGANGQQRGYDYGHASTIPHSTGANTRLDDFLRLEDRATETDVGMVPASARQNFHLRDIHLQEADDSMETLYPQLYGISEPWLRLVSQTTRLANTISHFQRGGQIPGGAASIETQRQRLEEKICTFAGTDQQDIPPQASQPPPTDLEQPALYMLRALNSALIIFFYRRIRDVSPLILQTHVDNVIRALEQYDLSCHFHETKGPGCPWPAFVAGCEAMSRAQRDYLSGWLEKAATVTGFTRFAAARNCVHEVWTRRDGARPGGRDRKIGDQVWSWVHVCQQQNIHMLLS